MSKSIISEGKTTTEAIENGLRELKMRKDMVEIKVLEQEDKRSFFSILAPRVVKVELTVKEGAENRRFEKKYEDIPHHEPIGEKELKQAEENLEKFLKDFTEKLSGTIQYNIKCTNELITVSLMGDNINFLIGYRGEVLNSLQIVVSGIANKGLEQRVKVLLDIEGYREKRAKTLEELAEKIAKTVIRTGKKVTLEPMTAFERKIIHCKLQENNKVKTYSIGEEPKRKVVIALK